MATSTYPRKGSSLFDCIWVTFQSFSVRTEFLLINFWGEMKDAIWIVALECNLVDLFGLLAGWTINKVGKPKSELHGGTVKRTLTHCSHEKNSKATNEFKGPLCSSLLLVRMKTSKPHIYIQCASRLTSFRLLFLNEISDRINNRHHYSSIAEAAVYLI